MGMSLHEDEHCIRYSGHLEYHFEVLAQMAPRAAPYEKSEQGIEYDSGKGKEGVQPATQPGHVHSLLNSRAIRFTSIL